MCRSSCNLLWIPRDGTKKTVDRMLRSNCTIVCYHTVEHCMVTDNGKILPLQYSARLTSYSILDYLNSLLTKFLYNMNISPIYKKSLACESLSRGTFASCNIQFLCLPTKLEVNQWEVQEYIDSILNRRPRARGCFLIRKM